MIVLNGKITLVTGAAMGIGHAIAEMLAEAGATVFPADIVPLTQPYSSADIVPLKLDVTSEQSWKEAVDAILAKHGQLDMLVNNAGIIGAYDPIDSMSLEDWSRTILVNKTGPFLSMRAALAPMKKASKGAIVNLSPIWGIAGVAGVAAYQASKGAVRTMITAVRLPDLRRTLRFGSRRVLRHTLGPATACTCLLATPATAQLLPPSPTGFQIAYGEESWDDPSTAGVSAPLKNIALDDDGLIRLDLGGGLRERGEAYRNPVFALAEAGGRRRDAYLLHRLLLNANLRVGDRVRAFVQFENAAQTGRSPAALPTDRNSADLAQAFAEATVPVGTAEFGLRGGRQEMALGSARLIDIREGPNVRQRFDGVRGWAQAGEARVDLFWTQPVQNRPDSFDDRSDPTQDFYGIHLSTPVAAVPGLRVDAYAYRLHRDGAVLDAGTADERRNTYGLRLSGKAGPVDYDFEFSRQTGRFGRRDIDAYALFSDTGYTFADAALQPRLALKAEAVSGGDSRGAGDLGTFYPLFPKLNELNEANIQSFANFVRLFPYATVRPRADLALMAGVEFQWREDRDDSFYQPPARAILPGNANRRRRLGEVLVAQVEWQATANLNFNASAVRFITKGYLQAAGARDQSWAGLWGTFRF